MSVPGNSWTTAVLAATLAFAAVVPSAQAACRHANLVPTAKNRGKVERAMRCVTNAERTKRGLTALKPESHLRKAASTHARSMVSQGYFAHQDKQGRGARARVQTAGYARGFRLFDNLENIAFGFGSGRASARAIVSAWLNNAAHRVVLLSASMREIGVAVAIGQPRPGGAHAGGATWVMELGVRKAKHTPKHKRNP
jgi:uncharacterized protein YkwD